MDPLAYKIQAIKKHKRQQFVRNVLLYTLSTLAFMLFCCSPFWYPSFSATFNVIFFVSIPEIISFFFSIKVLFIVGNLIIIFLVVEWKFFTSWSMASYCDIFYDTYKCKTPDLQLFSCSSNQAIKSYVEVKSYEYEEKILKSNGGDDQEERMADVSLRGDELKKLADNFIARINRQRRLEAQFCRG